MPQIINTSIGSLIAQRKSEIDQVTSQTINVSRIQNSTIVAALGSMTAAPTQSTVVSGLTATVAAAGSSPSMASASFPVTLLTGLWWLAHGNAVDAAGDAEHAGAMAGVFAAALSGRDYTSNQMNAPMRPVVWSRRYE